MCSNNKHTIEELKSYIEKYLYEGLTYRVLKEKYGEDYKTMEVLLTDITEFKYGAYSKAYLSAILDYGDNEIIAFKLSHHNNNALVNDTVMQIKDLILPTKTLLHSDRGFNISRGIIKGEMYRLKTYDTFEELETDIKRYIEFYNTKRVTLKMGLKIPA